ncbi:hypothetical protein BDFB_012606, partial [Asbolus verrucosus]
MIGRLKEFGNTLSVPVLRSFLLNSLKYLSMKSFHKLLICVVLPEKKEVVNQKKTSEVIENLRQIMEVASSSSVCHLSQE